MQGTELKLKTKHLFRIKNYKMKNINLHLSVCTKIKCISPLI